MAATDEKGKNEMSAPKRIQQRRTKGWRKPEGAVSVARPSKWGNPYTIKEMQKRGDLIAADLGEENTLDARAMAVEAFRSDLMYGPDSIWWWYGPHMNILRILADLEELRGKDLMCFCPLDEICHADVLLELANGVRGDG